MLKLIRIKNAKSSTLLKGVAKGALTLEAADAKLEKWLGEKQAKIDLKSKSVVSKSDETKRAALKAETAVKEAKSAKIAEKLAADLAVETPAAEVTEAPATEAAADETAEA